MNKSELTNQQIKTVIAGYPEILLCILYGSLAKAEETATSDVDIAVAAGQPLTSSKKNF